MDPNTEHSNYEYMLALESRCLQVEVCAPELFFETRQDETGGHFPNSRDHFDKTHQNTHSPIVYEIDPFFYVFMSHKYHPCFTFKLNAFITLLIQSLTQPWHKWFWKILPANKADNFSPVLISYQEILQTLAL